jgi:hypothetical protein
MTVAAPPRPPRPSDPVERDDPEALIEEARQRTRRRRRRYAAAATVLVLIGVALSIVFARPGPSQDASAGLPAPAATPDQDAGATLIAHYERFHVGYVLAYGDGRVIWQFATGPVMSPLLERHLTPDGVELVRSGAMWIGTLFGEGTVSLCAGDRRPRVSFGWLRYCDPNFPRAPAGSWADSAIGTYEPSRWSIGALSESEIGRFPAAAQAVLRGAERATYNNVFLLYPDMPDMPTFPTESIELTTAELNVIRMALIDEGIPLVSDSSVSDPNAPVGGPFVSPSWIKLGNTLNLFPSPILPHGEPVAVLG